MTTIYEAPMAVGQLHALIIGVDHYPYCGPRNGLPAEWRELGRAIKPLSCAAPSALAMVEWLLRHRDDELHPVGSVELLMSSSQQQHIGGVAVEAATLANVQGAFDRWYARCDRHVDDVALLFFCGHGLRIGSEDILLLEDFGSTPGQIFTNAVDFAETYDGMLASRASIQCSFIDACRNIPEDLVRKRRVSATALRHGAPELASRDAPIIYSTVPGSRAPATFRTPTRFTTAAIQALEGAAAEKTGDRWEVKTDMLKPRINSLLGWDLPVGGPRQFTSPGGEAHGGTIHAIEEPAVPFRIGCDPESVLSSARLRLANGTCQRSHEPDGELWQDQTPANSYQLTATCTAETFRSSSTDLLVLPPYLDYRLKVRRSR